ncbi:hypothetical protein D3C80_911280 [compost metagenome]
MRQDHAAFQLSGARVGRAGEVDGAALGPEGVPVAGHGLNTGGIGRGLRRVRGLVEADHDGQPVAAIGDDAEAVSPALLDLTRGGDAGIIGRVVQGAANADVASVESDDIQALGVRAVKAGRVGVDGRVHAGIADLDAEAFRRHQRRGDLDHDQVQGRVDAGDHLDRLTVIGEAAGQGAGPQVQGLARVRHLGEVQGATVVEAQADAAERDPMRIGAQPGVGGVGLGVGPGLHPGVGLLAATGDRDFDQAVGLGIALGVGEAVPGPLGHGQQGRQFRILLGEGLQAGDVGGEAQIAVAQLDRGMTVDGGQRHIVTLGQGLPVDRGRRSDRRDGLDGLGAGAQRKGDGAGQQGEGEQGGTQTHQLASVFRPRPAPFQPYQATTTKQAAGSRKAMLAP